MNFRKSFTVVFVSLCLFVFSSCNKQNFNEASVVIETKKGPIQVKVEIADTPESQAKGLMFRTELKKGHGMFFIFDKEQYLSFWMKNTLIPLDMIFFDKNYQIVHIVENVLPCKTSPCKFYLSGKPAQFVLEIGSGESKSLNIEVGNKARLENNFSIFNFSIF